MLNNNNSTKNTQNTQNNINKKPWNTKNECEQYKKQYINSCKDKLEKGVISETNYNGCLEFANNYYNC
jgi:hypothetical protein